MPPSRRRLPGGGQPSPSRRPRVAGSRKPSSPHRAPGDPVRPDAPADEATATDRSASAASDGGEPDSRHTEGGDATVSEEKTRPSPRPRPSPKPRRPVPTTAGIDVVETGTTGGGSPEADATESGADSTSAPTGSDPTGPDPESDSGATETGNATTDPGEPTLVDAASPTATTAPAESPAESGTGSASGPTVADTAEPGADDPGTTERAERRSDVAERRLRPSVGYVGVAVLLAATLAFAGLAAFFKIKHGDAEAAVSNTALVDAATTSEVEQAMSDAAEQLLSIDYNNLDKTQRAADRLLVGTDAKRTYDTLMGQFREQAPEQKLVVTVTAVRSAVVLLDDDRARVMVYVDQTATRAGQPASSGPAALWLETRREDGRWKVVDLNTYADGQSDGAQSVPSTSGSQPPSSQAEESTEGN